MWLMSCVWTCSLTALPTSAPSELQLESLSPMQCLNPSPTTCRHLGIKQLLVGGKNPDWETPKISEIPVGCLTLSEPMRCQYQP